MSSNQQLTLYQLPSRLNAVERATLVHGTYAEKQHVLMVAAMRAMGIPAHLMTGSSNYSSARLDSQVYQTGFGRTLEKAKSEG